MAQRAFHQIVTDDQYFGEVITDLYAAILPFMVHNGTVENYLADDGEVTVTATFDYAGGTLGDILGDVDHVIVTAAALSSANYTTGSGRVTD